MSVGGQPQRGIIVIIMGLPVEACGSTNLMKVHKLGTGEFYEIY